MPFGIWGESDWQTGAKPKVPAQKRSEPNHSSRQTLQRACGDARKSKSSVGTKRCLLSAGLGTEYPSSSLLNRSTLNPRELGSGISAGILPLGETFAETRDEQIIDSTEIALRRWTSGFSIFSTCRPTYDVVGNNSNLSTSAGSLSTRPCSASSGDAPVANLAAYSPDRSRRIEDVAHCEGDPDRFDDEIVRGNVESHEISVQKRKAKEEKKERNEKKQYEETLFKAMETLAESKFTNVSAKDVLSLCLQQASHDRPENALEVCNLFGTMTDQIRNILKKLPSTLGQEDEDSPEEKETTEPASPLLRHAGLRWSVAVNNVSALRDRVVVDRPRTVILLKKVLKGFDHLHQKYSDMERWVTVAEAHDVQVREMIDQSSNEEGELLNLLTMSRFLIEEALGVHLLTGVQVLSEFYEKMSAMHFRYRRNFRSLAGKSFKDGEKGSNENTRDSPQDGGNPEYRRQQIVQTILGMKGLKERCQRQIEMNRNLFGAMVSRKEETDKETKTKSAVGALAHKGGHKKCVVLRAEEPVEALPAPSPAGVDSGTNNTGTGVPTPLGDFGANNTGTDVPTPLGSLNTSLKLHSPTSSTPISLTSLLSPLNMLGSCKDFAGKDGVQTQVDMQIARKCASSKSMLAEINAMDINKNALMDSLRTKIRQGHVKSSNNSSVTARQASKGIAGEDRENLDTAIPVLKTGQTQRSNTEMMEIDWLNRRKKELMETLDKCYSDLDLLEQEAAKNTEEDEIVKLASIDSHKQKNKRKTGRSKEFSLNDAPPAVDTRRRGGLLVSQQRRKDVADESVLNETGLRPSWDASWDASAASHEDLAEVRRLDEECANAAGKLEKLQESAANMFDLVCSGKAAQPWRYKRDENGKVRVWFVEQPEELILRRISQEMENALGEDPALPDPHGLFEAAQREIKALLADYGSKRRNAERSAESGMADLQEDDLQRSVDDRIVKVLLQLQQWREANSAAEVANQKLEVEDAIARKTLKVNEVLRHVGELAAQKRAHTIVNGDAEVISKATAEMERETESLQVLNESYIRLTEKRATTARQKQELTQVTKQLELVRQRIQDAAVQGLAYNPDRANRRFGASGLVTENGGTTWETIEERRLSSNPDHLLPEAGAASLVPQDLRGSYSTVEQAMQVQATDSAKMQQLVRDAKIKGSVLQTRMERKTMELKRTIAKMSMGQSKNESGVKPFVDTAKMKAKWANAIADLQTRLQTTNRMYQFWDKRIETWKQELLHKYGEDVSDIMEDAETRQEIIEKKNRRTGAFTPSLPEDLNGRRMAAADTRRVFINGTAMASDNWALAQQQCRISTAFMEGFSALARRSETTSAWDPSQCCKILEPTHKAIITKQSAAFWRKFQGVESENNEQNGKFTFKAVARKCLSKMGGGFRLGKTTVTNVWKPKRHLVKQTSGKVDSIPMQSHFRTKVIDLFAGSAANVIYKSDASQPQKTVIKKKTPPQVPPGTEIAPEFKSWASAEASVKEEYLKEKQASQVAREPSPRKELKKAATIDLSKMRSSIVDESAKLPKGRENSICESNQLRNRLHSLQWRKGQSVSGSAPPTATKVNFLKMFMDDVGRTGESVRESDESVAESPTKPKLLNRLQNAVRSVEDDLARDVNKQPTIESNSDFSSGDTETERFDPDEAVWFDVADDEKQKTLQLLRICRDRLVQRFGGIDKSHIVSAPAVTGMTEEVFLQLTEMMGFSYDESQLMFKHILEAALPRHDEIENPRGNLSIGHKQQICISRLRFVEAFRQVAPVRNFRQLKTRLKNLFNSVDAALHAMSTSGAAVRPHGRDRLNPSSTVTASTFRDFVAEVGVGALEARSLFVEMADHCCSEKAPGQAPEVSIRAMALCLRYCEGLASAARFRTILASKIQRTIRLLPEPAEREKVCTQFARRASTDDSKVCAAGFRSSSKEKNPDFSPSRRGTIASPRRLSSKRMSSDLASPRRLSMSRRMSTDLVSPRRLSTNRRMSIPKRMSLATEAPHPRRSSDANNAGIVRQKAFASSARRASEDAGKWTNEEERRRSFLQVLRASEDEISNNFKGQISLMSNERARRMYNVVLESMAVKVDPLQAITQDEFTNALKNFAILPSDTFAMFKLCEPDDDQKCVLREILLRVLAGFGPCYQKIREHFGWPVQEKRSQKNVRGTVKSGARQTIIRQMTRLRSSLEISAGTGIDKRRRKSKMRIQFRATFKTKTTWLKKIRSNRAENQQFFEHGYANSGGEASAEDNVDEVAEGFAELGPSGPKRKLIGLEIDIGNLPTTEPSQRKTLKKCPAHYRRRSLARREDEEDGPRAGLLDFELGDQFKPEEKNAMRVHQTPRSVTRKLVTAGSMMAITDTGGGLAIGFDDEGKTDESWAFKDEDKLMSQPFPENEISNEKLPPKKIEHSSLAGAEDKQRKLTSKRALLFNADPVELEIATQKWQESAVTLLQIVKGSQVKAYEVLAGSCDATLSETELRSRLLRILRSNPLDAERLSAIIFSMGDWQRLDYNGFREAIQYARRSPTLLEFRERLVLRCKTVDTALGVLDFRNLDLSVDVFEKPLLLQGVLGRDARRLFKVMDSLQPGGPKGFLTVEAVRAAIDDGHVVQWIELLLQRLRDPKRVRTVLAAVGKPTDALPDSEAVDRLLEPLGLPSMCAPALHAVLRRSAGEKEVTIGTLSQLLQNFMGTESKETRESKDNVAMPNKLSGPSDSVRVKALDDLSALRNYCISHHENWKESFDKFRCRNSQDGVALDEWEDNMGTFGFHDKHAWLNVFGHLINWQHLRWQKNNKQANASVTLSVFATALNNAAPCNSVASLKQRFTDEFGSLQKAWTFITKKDGAEDVKVDQWQKSLQALSITHGNAVGIFHLLRGIPCTGHAPDVNQLSHKAFLEAMKGHSVEANDRLVRILLRLSNVYGPVSRAFEVEFPSDSLPLNSFVEHVADLLDCPKVDVRSLFQHLDVHRTGKVEIVELMRVLTQIQVALLPYRDGKAPKKETKIVENLVDANSSVGQPADLNRMEETLQIRKSLGASHLTSQQGETQSVRSVLQDTNEEFSDTNLNMVGTSTDCAADTCQTASTVIPESGSALRMALCSGNSSTMGPLSSEGIPRSAPCDVAATSNLQSSQSHFPKGWAKRIPNFFPPDGSAECPARLSLGRPLTTPHVQATPRHARLNANTGRILLGHVASQASTPVSFDEIESSITASSVPQASVRFQSLGWAVSKQVAAAKRAPKAINAEEASPHLKTFGVSLVESLNPPTSNFTTLPSLSVSAPSAGQRVRQKPSVAATGARLKKGSVKSLVLAAIARK